jgi:hypothetical protein
MRKANNSWYNKNSPQEANIKTPPTCLAAFAGAIREESETHSDSVGWIEKPVEAMDWEACSL